MFLLCNSRLGKRLWHCCYETFPVGKGLLAFGVVLQFACSQCRACFWIL